MKDSKHDILQLPNGSNGRKNNTLKKLVVIYGFLITLHGKRSYQKYNINFSSASFFSVHLKSRLKAFKTSLFYHF